MVIQGIECPESLGDMIWGFAREIRNYFDNEEMGPCGGQEQQQVWRDDTRSRRTRINEGVVNLATVIANMTWYKGNESHVEGVIEVFHLIPVGYMSPPVVMTLIKWLGADLNNAESCEKAVDRLLEMLNHHWSGWRRVESSTGPFPALEEADRLLSLTNELKGVALLPYRVNFGSDFGDDFYCGD